MTDAHHDQDPTAVGPDLPPRPLVPPQLEGQQEIPWPNRRGTDPMDGQISLSSTQLVLRFSRVGWGAIRVDHAYVMPNQAEPPQWAVWSQIPNQINTPRRLWGAARTLISVWLERERRSHDLF